MSKIQPVRGTHDLLPETSERFRWIEKVGFDVASRYGFGEIQTPIVEFTHIFAKSLGESTDIVAKEMYVFDDRGGDSLCLRPEGTAGIARAFISEGLAQRVPLKLSYSGPMFRYERPQKGRQRQFHQFGVEFFGVFKAQSDIEVIALGHQMLCELGLKGKFQLEINTLGSSACRARFRENLVNYLTPLADKLSPDSKNRLSINPLRILDSKDEGDQELLINAPRFSEALDEESQTYFTDVLNGLEQLKIPYSLNQRLVRGLDYYDHTVFEFTTNLLGAQNAILSGGRYNGLVAAMGGKPTPAVGFAAGLERLSMLLDDKDLPQPNRPIALVPQGNSEDYCLRLAYELRQNGLQVDVGYSGNFAKRLKRANKLNARFAIIVGDDELASNQLTGKELETGEPQSVDQASITDFLTHHASST